MYEKIIYYCWFGQKPLTNETQQLIETWRLHFPDHAIIEINESNFDVTAYPYAEQAYEKGRYAFVSDCARVHFLQKTGGIYFDTDVEVLKGFDRLLGNEDILFSMEYFFYEITGISTAVICSKKDQKLWDDLLDHYRVTDFDNVLEPETINKKINNLLEKNTAFTYKDGMTQMLNYRGQLIKIVPSKLLMRPSSNAYAVHHLTGSWKNNLSLSRKVRRFVGVHMKRIIGRERFYKIWKKNK